MSESARANPPSSYLPRVVDGELDELLSHLPAIAIEGAKGVGKSRAALQHATSVRRLDEPTERIIAQADPARLLEGEPPVLIDEWQRVPEVWDLVRRAVDDDNSPGRFILTGSAVPAELPAHSGAGRIVTVRMRPLSLAERQIESPQISLGSLLSGTQPNIQGRTDVTLERYVEEIIASGFPGLRGLAGRPLRAQLDGYIRLITERDFPELGHTVRKPDTHMRWLRAYAAATATTASYETIRDAATSDRGEKPSKSATQPYTDVLERLWVLDRVDAWLPSRNAISRLSAPPKHHLVDPALAARLLGAGADTLLAGKEPGPVIPRDGTLLGALFESLVTQSVRVYAQAAEAQVRHLRTYGGDHEVDLIVVRDDGKIVAVEVKLNRTILDADVRHLTWLRERAGDDLLDAVVISTGPEAYRRTDGIAVVPAALLGP
ncbi:MAG: ATP-binding protein [Thermomicrobiales bacterium]|nr:ATP-binding protein [Thermomicrobiales bacterium]